MNLVKLAGSANSVVYLQRVYHPILMTLQFLDVHKGQASLHLEDGEQRSEHINPRRLQQVHFLLLQQKWVFLVMSEF